MDSKRQVRAILAHQLRPVVCVELFTKGTLKIGELYYLNRRISLADALPPSSELRPSPPRYLNCGIACDSSVSSLPYRIRHDNCTTDCNHHQACEDNIAQ